MNNEAINKLQVLVKIINKLDKHTYNQAYNYVLRQICNSSVAMSNMTVQQLVDFENDLIECVNYKFVLSQ